MIYSYDFIIKIGSETVAKKMKIVLKEYICNRGSTKGSTRKISRIERRHMSRNY